jgi:FMN reductase (NADPH)
MNAVIDCLMNHRSIRKFKSKPVEPEKMDLILKAGTRAATAGNLQHYSLIVVDDDEKKRALGNDPGFESSTMIVAVVDTYRLKRWFELNGAPFYFDQACNLFIGFWDAIVALQNVVIAAESLGLGTVYLGEVLSKDLGQILGTPEYVFPAGLVVVGYPDESPDLRPRLPLEAVVHRNRYELPSDDEITAFYREKDRAWKDLPEESRRDLLARNIRNTAQRVTVGHYTEEFITGESKAIIENLKKACFKLTLD